jgi:putative membrane protein insertion efficiency factor
MKSQALLMKSAIIFVLKIYKNGISPIFLGLFGHACRYKPTCSEYFAEAVSVHGVRHGLVLGVRRLCRCHPFTHSKQFFDPVPANY